MPPRSAGARLPGEKGGAPCERRPSGEVLDLVGLGGFGVVVGLFFEFWGAFGSFIGLCLKAFLGGWGRLGGLGVCSACSEFACCAV